MFKQALQCSGEGQQHLAVTFRDLESRMERRAPVGQDWTLHGVV